ncbi:juvenile hormone epoxide hydrolase 2 isoform X2 [Orussus abietinus]|uniref:juvenile hormone epoxide hydrolase 2 isoform X2 n=1 Tax=Orussus abietinus TaxID=222816 RepID=UPI000626E077|nr:juvenile hormone epoxide hydrolase 2 isoform X2 [Orussus abietinus]
MSLIKLAIATGILLGASYLLNNPAPQIPVLPETWWGPRNEEIVDKSIRPFKDVEDLKTRLRNTRMPQPSMEGTAWTYGIHSNFIPIIIDHWLKYDFQKREAHINKYPQFTTNIQGLDIHFLHVKPEKTEGKRVLPLLILHGWPGSVLEFYKIIPLLTSPRKNFDVVFEIIAPSLPGFGFSSGAIKPGLGATQMAVVLKNLMLRLGFQKFYSQGGDWGAIITEQMASLFPEHVSRIHSNMCVSTAPWTLFKTILYSLFPSLIVSDEDYHLLYPLSKHWVQMFKNSAYFHLQATRPDIIGIAFSDSPVGFAAYILEKFAGATNKSNLLKDDGGLFETFTPDELIDNLMMYWISNSQTTSMRIYAESFNHDRYKLGLDSLPITVPSACAQFPNEIFYQPKGLLKDRFKNLIRVTRMPRGGHFAAMEEPELLADDIWLSLGNI